MPETVYRNRQAYSIENDLLEVVVTNEGGHIAVIRDKSTGVNPLWSPPWPSIEPSTYDPARHPEYGGNAESRLLAGILGHNLCLDLFGGPSDEEAAAGLTVHGEGSVARTPSAPAGTLLQSPSSLPARSSPSNARSGSAPARAALAIEETVENLAICDRPAAWTQHVTLGPPFLEKGATQFRANARKSKVIENDFTGGKGYMQIGAEFNWPNVPLAAGGHEDMRVYTDRPVSGAFSTHLMDPTSDTAYFTAWSPAYKLGIAYVWPRADFPWLGIWEENSSRSSTPWNGKTLTRGMEFGASPFPETRRAMINRGSLFGVPGYRWIPARQRVTVNYSAMVGPAGSADEFTAEALR